METGSNRLSVTFISGGRCEVRTYDRSGATERIDTGTWKLDDGGVQVSTPTDSHHLRFDGSQLSDGAWTLRRN